MTSTADPFIGSGWAFPVRTNAIGELALVSRDRELEESVRLILSTSPGERPMRPDFGCRIHDHVFAQADATTAGTIAHEVTSSLQRWEPRIDGVDVTVSFDADEPSLLYIQVGYMVRDTNDARNLVFPFYVIPEEGE